jgi:predicted HAD superfamily Cof-like phosphohydrolase
MRRLLGDVATFHWKFGVPVEQRPLRSPHAERVRLRARLMLEECIETLESMYDRTDQETSLTLSTARELLRDVVEYAPVKVDLVGVADGIVDQVYVLCGTGLELGLGQCLPAVWEAVHEANMRKVADPGGGKVRKGPGWVPPDVERIVYGTES